MDHHLDTKYLSRNPRIEKMRDGAGIGLVELGEKKEDVIVLGADTIGSTRAKFFQEKFPFRTIQVGVAEQNLIGVTAGLSYYGKVPYAVTYAPFLIGRAWEPIRTLLCYPNNHAVLIGTHAGIATGSDGPTHQMTEDIALTTSLPNMTVFAPLDYEQAKKAVKAAYDVTGPVYIRIVREGTEVVTTEDTPFEIGKAQLLREGGDVTVIAHGYMVARLLKIAEKVKDKVSLEVINVHTLKPIDVDTIVKSAQKTGKVFVVEDHNVKGGLGSIVSQTLAEAGTLVPVKIHGVYDQFAESGSPKDLWKKYRLDIAGTQKVLETFLKNI